MGADDTDYASPVVYIPYEGDANEDQNHMRLFAQDDEALELVGLRLEAYRKSWQKCLQRLQSSIRSQHEAMVKDVVQHIQNAYTEKPVISPFQELPVVCIQSSLCGSSLLGDIFASLDNVDGPKNFRVHLRPSDCPNLTGGMRVVIAQVTEQSDALGSVKRRPSASLANFDVEMLVAWYTAACNVSDDTPDPLLTIIMHDFEQFNPSLVQDMFYIFSQIVTKLRTVFVLSLSSPATPSFLHFAYPKSTLSLLCLDTFVAPPGYSVLEKALQDSFFDVESDPDILLGPTTLAQIINHLKKTNVSQDAFLTCIQLVHLRHFLLNPLSFLVEETPRLLSSNKVVRDIVARRLEICDKPNARERMRKGDSQHSASIDQARRNFALHSRKMRLGFGLVQLIHSFAQAQDIEDRQVPHIDLIDMMLETLRGKAYKYVQRLTPFIRKLDECRLTSLLDQLHEYFEKPPLLQDERKAREEIAKFLSFIFDGSKRPENVTCDLSEWLEDYVESLSKRLDDLPLWEVWHTGDAPFPSEFVNPSSRASILSALLRPHEYALDPDAEPLGYKAAEIWELSDISILFQRYTESGRMINVYDWFESFQLALEGQREYLKKQEPAHGAESPRKRGSKGRVSLNHAEKAEMSEEQWKVEVQSRFMRALHELDYLGFIKHTGRKADHVLRTNFNVGD